MTCNLCFDDWVQYIILGCQNFVCMQTVLQKSKTIYTPNPSTIINNLYEHDIQVISSLSTKIIKVFDERINPNT